MKDLPLKQPGPAPQFRPDRAPRPEPQAAAPHASRQFREALKRLADLEGRERDGQGLTGLAAQAPAPGQAPVAMALTPQTPDPATLAFLERIAAAIDELRAGGGDPTLHLTMQNGSLPVDGALIGRDATGALTIMLTTPNAVPPAMALQLRTQLAERLARRDLRVSRIALQRVDAGSAGGR